VDAIYACDYPVVQSCLLLMAGMCWSGRPALPAVRSESDGV